MSKRQATAVIVAMSMVGLPLLLTAGPAMAATTPSTAGVQTITVISSDRDEYEDEDDDEYEHEYEHEQENHGYIPPVVIRPHHEDDEDDDDDDDAYTQGGGLTPVPSITPSPQPTLGGVAPSGASNRSSRYDFAPIDPSIQSTEGFQAPAEGLDPQAAPAIDVAGIQTTTKTPADVFVESATLGLSAMGVGALAFGGAASVRAIRVRKNPQRDYFYDGDK